MGGGRWEVGGGRRALDGTQSSTYDKQHAGDGVRKGSTEGLKREQLDVLGQAAHSTSATRKGGGVEGAPSQGVSAQVPQAPHA